MLSNRRLSLLLAICVTILGLSRIAAQDATPISPPTETSVPTLAPTEIPTDVPSATPLPIFTLTLTPTPLPTETPTFLPTPTASDTATETPTETPTLQASASPTETAMAEPSPTLLTTEIDQAVEVDENSSAQQNTDLYAPTLTAVPSGSQNTFSMQSGVANTNALASTIYERNVTNVGEFTSAVSEANADCNNTYVIYLSAGPYTVVPTDPRGILMSGKIVLVGNHLSPSAIDPAVPESNKVVFSSGSSGTGIFFVNNSCASLTIYNVVLKGNALSPVNAGGAITNNTTLNVYSSYFLNNKAVTWGGAIYSGSALDRTNNLSIINSVFEGNQSTGAYLNTGGGAIATQYGSSLSVECSSFKNNYSRNVGGAFYFFADSGAITFKHLLTSGAVDPTLSNNFETNTATNGWGGFYSLPAVDATNQYWNPAPSTVAGNANSVFGISFTPTLSSAVQPNPPNSNCALPSVALAAVNAQLQFYGVTVTGDWNGLEQDVLDAVVITGQALAAQSTGNDLPQDAFKRVMGATLTFNRGSFGLGPICKTNPQSLTINCDLTNQTTVFTIVHELGHMFNFRSGGQTSGSGSLFDQLQKVGTSVKDLNPILNQRYVVFGGRLFRDDINGYDEWWRGTYGWGSPAVQPWLCDGSSSSIPSNFQQNPCDLYDTPTKQLTSDEKALEIEEAAADFFLNWVYRKLSQGGFENNKWTGACLTITDCPDGVLKTGNVRMTWMDDPSLNANGKPIGAMPRIFSDRVWN